MSKKLPVLLSAMLVLSLVSPTAFAEIVLSLIIALNLHIRVSISM